MLQRSYRYFREPLRDVSDATGVMFSNYHLRSPIIIPNFLELRPAISERHAAAIAVNLKVYSPGMRPGSYMTPPNEVFKQVRQAVSLYTNAFFASSPDDVIAYSSSNPGLFLKPTFEENRNSTESDQQNLVAFLIKLVQLPRITFVTVSRCLAAQEHALMALLHHPELTYSLLVFALESLSQNFDSFVPSWEKDYPARDQLDLILEKIDPKIADDVRAQLLASAHLKLQARVRTFVSKNIPADFFSLGKGMPPRVRRSNLERVIESAYELRSRYAHQLLAADNMLTLEGGPPGEICSVIGADSTTREFLTIRGLQRLVRDVLINFVNSQESVTEKFEHIGGVEQPPGFIISLAPESWLNAVEEMTSENARQCYEGLLYSYDIRFVEGRNSPKLLGVNAQTGLALFDIRADAPRIFN